MQTLQWLQTQLPFLQAEWFSVLYGLVVFLNPLALVPQLISSIRSKPEELHGIAVSMFAIFLAIQTAVSFGAIKNMDMSLFLSMSISVIITFLVIVITVGRRNGLFKM